MESLTARLTSLQDSAIAYLSENDLKLVLSQFLTTQSRALGTKAYTSVLVPLGETYLECQHKLDVALAPVNARVSEMGRPVVAAFAPVHEVLSAKAVGPISWYLVILLVVQLVIQFYPRLNRDKVIARHILVKDEEEVKSIQAQLKLSNTLARFAELAKEFSLCTESKDKGGLLPPFGRKEREEEVDKYCFDRKVKEWVVSKPIKTEKGWHLVMVVKKCEVRDWKNHKQNHPQLLVNMDALLAQLKPVLEQLQPVIDQLKVALAPLAPIHEVLRQKVVGPLNGYTLIILAFQLLQFIWPKGSGGKGQVAASHILVKEESKIKELATILEKEHTEAKFSELAKKHSVCPSGKKGGSLGTFGKGQMVKEFEVYCFDEKTEVGKVSPVIKTQFGYHLIMVTKKPEA
ncbi:hypothetical protein HDU98_009104 [Podochytrium sp. JEL0797]|nr:hypothetical protein HDU98_009104 [Podochytrium sp. JEL0797]